MASFPRVVLPTSSQNAAWRKLCNEHVAAYGKGNLELAADHAGEAGHQASAFWGRDSLMAVEYHTYVVRHFTEMALDGPPNIETDGCRRRAMVELLRDVLPQLSHRLTAGTLSVGKCRQAEEAYFAEFLAAYSRKHNLHLDDRQIAHECKTFGASRVLDAMLATVHLLALPPWQEAQLKECQSFVFACLTFIGSCGVRFVDGDKPTSRVEERTLFTDLSALGADISSLNTAYDKAFFEEVLQKWAALCDKCKRGAAAKETPRAAPFKKCALPSCDKAERTDAEFSLCALCKDAKYCSGEHQKADWKRHKKECKNKSAEQGMLTTR